MSKILRDTTNTLATRGHVYMAADNIYGLIEENIRTTKNLPDYDLSTNIALPTALMIAAAQTLYMQDANVNELRDVFNTVRDDVTKYFEQAAQLRDRVTGKGIVDGETPEQRFINMLKQALGGDVRVIAIPQREEPQQPRQLNAADRAQIERATERFLQDVDLGDETKH